MRLPPDTEPVTDHPRSSYSAFHSLRRSSAAPFDGYSLPSRHVHSTYVGVPAIYLFSRPRARGLELPAPRAVPLIDPPDAHVFGLEQDDQENEPPDRRSE